MWHPDVSVKYAPLPLSVRGTVIPSSDGNFVVIINQNLPEEQQLEVYQHEREHILRDHLYDDIRPITEIEAEADRHPGERKHPARPPAPAPAKKERLPDIFGECPDGKIPVFSSLETMSGYIKAYLQQFREDRKNK